MAFGAEDICVWCMPMINGSEQLVLAVSLDILIFFRTGGGEIEALRFRESRSSRSCSITLRFSPKKLCNCAFSVEELSELVRFNFSSSVDS